MPFQRIQLQHIPPSANVKMDRQITTQSNTPLGWTLGFQWVLANVVGWVIVGAMIGTLLKPGGDVVGWNIVWIGVLVVVLITTGVGVGIARWPTLRRHGYWAGLWIWSSLISWPVSLTVGWAVGRVAGEFVVLVALCATAGALLRIMQWLIWRRGAYQTRWWVAAWVAGLAMGLVMGWTVGWIFGWQVGSAVRTAMGEITLGMREWTIMKPQFYQFSWWTLASLVGWTVGRALLEILEWSALRRSGYQQAGRWVLAGIGIGSLNVSWGWGLEFGSLVGLVAGFPVTSAVGLVVGWVIVGAIAGSLLFGLSRYSV
jgi:hypothetical protein